MAEIRKRGTERARRPGVNPRGSLNVVGPTLTLETSPLPWFSSPPRQNDFFLQFFNLCSPPFFHRLRLQFSFLSAGPSYSILERSQVGLVGAAAHEHPPGVGVQTRATAANAPMAVDGSPRTELFETWLTSPDQ